MRTLALGLFVVGGLWGQEPADLLANGGFETHDGTRPAAWSLAGGAALRLDGPAHGGRAYVRVRFDDRVSQQVPAQEARWYMVTGFCRAEAPTRETPRVKVYFLNADGGRINAGGGTIPDVTADGWTAFEIPFSTPPGTARLSIDLIGEFGGKDWFWFDDVRLLPVASRAEPLAERLPEVAGRTVVIPDRADVRSYALYRIPPAAQSPIDGDLLTQAWTGRSARIRHRPPICDLELELERPTELSWALLHALNPGRQLAPARLEVGEQQVAIDPGDSFVSSLSFPPTLTDRARLRVLEADRRTAEIHEVQLFGLRDGVGWDGPTVELPLGAAPTEADRAVLAERYVREENRQALAAGAGARATEPVAIPAGRWLNLAVHPAAERTGVRGVTLRLDLAPAASDEVLEIGIKECAELDLNLVHAELADRGEAGAAQSPPRRGADLCRIYARRAGGAAGPLTIGFDLPDLVLEAGEALWVELRAPEGLTLNPAGSAVIVALCSPEQARAEYLPRLERLMRRLYSRETEAHPYDGRPYRDMILARLVHRVLEEDPGNAPATAILCRIAHRMPRVELSRPGPPEAPDWAVYGRHLQREWHRVLCWWLDHRWVESGEIGGDLNDDVEYSCHWPLSYLITGDDRIRAALRGIADAVWEQSGESGYSIVATDVEHAAEDSSCSLPQMLLCEYGNPLHVERMMKMSIHIPEWTGINERGRRQFRSYIFNANSVASGPKQDIDHLYCALAMVGATHLSWYNRHPLTTGWVAEYAQSWAETAMSTEKGKPVGALPCDVHYATSTIAPYTDRWDRSVYYSFGQYVMEYFLQGALRLGVDAGPRLAEAVGLIDGTPEQAVAKAAEGAARFATQPEPMAPGLPYGPDGSWVAPTSYERPAWRALAATGDKRPLEAILKATALEMERSRWLVTEAEPYTDRVPVPGTTLLRYMFLGGDVAGKTHVPGLAVSWEGGGTDFAALVLSAEDTSLKVLLYSFADRPLDMACRLWRLRPGRYRVLFGTDADQDDVADTDVETRELELRRWSRLPFTLPPGVTRVLEIAAVAVDAATPVLLPDLALAAEELRVEGDHWVVTVHNVGAADAPQTVAKLLGRGGEALATTPVPALPAPLDLQPRTVTVTLPRVAGGALVEVSAVGPEVCMENNQAPCPPTG